MPLPEAPCTGTETIGTALPKEMARVRDEVMPAYQAIGPAGAPALFLMRMELDIAAAAIMNGDVVTMLRAYESLKEFRL
jgi:hypothetical protein